MDKIASTIESLRESAANFISTVLHQTHKRPFVNLINSLHKISEGHPTMFLVLSYELARNWQIKGIHAHNDNVDFFTSENMATKLKQVSAHIEKEFLPPNAEDSDYIAALLAANLLPLIGLAYWFEAVYQYGKEKGIA